MPDGGYIIDLYISVEVEFGGRAKSDIQRGEWRSFDGEAVGDVSLASVSKEQKFIITAVFGARPDHKTLAMDAILISKEPSRGAIPKTA